MPARFRKRNKVSESLVSQWLTEKSTYKQEIWYTLQYDNLQLCAKFERDIPILNVWFVALTLTWNLANEEIRFSNADPKTSI